MDSPVVIFDGDCRFCRRSVELLRRLPKAANLGWVPRGSREAERLASDSGLPESLILIDDEGTHTGFEAVWRTMRHAGAPRILLAAARLVPRSVREAAYRWVARNRHRLCLGSACGPPKPDRRSQR
ncbi:MAG: thiol-disulfide oxidoreductase DCC family protein [Fimbriimonadaceae bacterium]